MIEMIIKDMLDADATPNEEAFVEQPSDIVQLCKKSDFCQREIILRLHDH